MSAVTGMGIINLPNRYDFPYHSAHAYLTAQFD